MVVSLHQIALTEAWIRLAGHPIKTQESPIKTGIPAAHCIALHRQSKRRGWDSNPRCPFRHAGFQDRCIQPLCHLSEGDILTWPRPAWVARHPCGDRFPTCLEMRSPTTRPGPNAGQDSPTGTLEKSQLEGAAEGLVWPETGAGPVENRAPQSCSRNHPNRPLCRGSKRLLTLSGLPGYHPAPFLQGAGQTHGFRLCRA